MSRIARRAAFIVVWAVLATSCSEPAKPRAGDEQAALGGEIAARATSGSVTDAVPVSLVASVAREQHVAPSVALRRLVDDAVASVAARDRSLDRRSPASWLLVAARGRIAADRLRLAAKAEGPPTDEEVNELSQRHWREVDRPITVRVVHAVVKRPSKDDPALTERARELATQLHDVLAATPTDDFVKKAKALPHAKDLDVVAESLPPITDDGWSTETPGRFDLDFSKAAHALAKPGDTSPVVESRFGWHVIRLVERLPEQRMPFESRRIAFAEEAVAMRAKRALDARLEALRRANPVSVQPSAEQLMRSVMTQPEESP